MITKIDIALLKETFVTKEDLEKSELKTADSFVVVQNQLDNMRSDINVLKQDMTELKNNMITMEDNIIHAIKNLQTESVITSSYRPKLDNHEKRISKIETIVLPA